MPAKRCPMCHQANEDRAWQCRRCGYEFGQPVETVLELLRARQRSQRIMLAIYASPVVLAVAACLLVWGRVPIFPLVLAFTTSTLWLARSYHRYALTRSSIRSLSAQRPQLPKATLKSG
jgi:hypothetical protein